jgi:hypothetical protein
MGTSQSGARTRVNTYTTSPIVALASFSFMTLVPFLPGEPLLPLLISVGLGIYSLRNPKWASRILCTLVFFSILWQLIGFGLMDSRLYGSSMGLASLGTVVSIILIIVLLVSLLSANMEPTSMALAILAVALMLTPQYYLSIAMIVAAAAIGGLLSIGPVSTTFIATLSPLLIIENAIYYASHSRYTPPIIFSQLTNLAENRIPSLPGLNIFLTGLNPNNYLSRFSKDFVQFVLSGSVYILVVPVVMLGIVFSSSASIAGIVNSALNRLSVFERTNRILRIISPFVASIVAPIAFFLLITSLSPPNIGGYQTSLPSDSVYMVSGSLLLGGLFTAREFLIQKLEHAERAKARLRILLEQGRSGVQRALEAVDKIVKGAPTVDLGTERKALNEYSSHIADIERGIQTASYDTLIGWIDELEKQFLPFLGNLPETFRLRMLNELNTLTSLTSTFNSILQESGVQARFPEFGALSGQMSLDDALQTYHKTILNIREAATKLFDEYVSATNSFNILMDRGAITPPVNPIYLFDSYDYLTGMKLLAEEYWLSFHISYNQELESKVKTLSSNLTQLVEMCDDELSTKVAHVLKSVGNVRPADSTYVLQKMMELQALLATVVDTALDQAEQLERLIKTFTSTSADLIHFEVIGQSTKLQVLKDELKNMKPTFGNLLNFAQTITSSLGDQAERRRKDENNLIVMSQYSVAKKVIEHLIQDRDVLEISDLPFLHEAAVIFAKLYSMTNPSVRYDDTNEVLIVRHA